MALERTSETVKHEALESQRIRTGGGNHHDIVAYRV